MLATMSFFIEHIAIFYRYRYFSCTTILHAQPTLDFRDNPMTTLQFRLNVKRLADLTSTRVHPTRRSAAVNWPATSRLVTAMQSAGTERLGNPALWPSSECRLSHAAT